MAASGDPEWSTQQQTLAFLWNRGWGTPRTTKWLWGGRVFLGPPQERARLFGVTAVLVLSSALFYFGVAMAATAATTTRLLGVIALPLVLLDFRWLYETAYTDPGIIPRRWQIVAGAARRDNQMIEAVTTQGRELGWRECKTCEVYRPPRASHCSWCDSCVLEFDHHCNFLAVCVGARNRRSFVCFLAATALLSLLGICACIRQLADSSGGNEAARSWSGRAHPAIPRLLMGGLCFGVYAGMRVVLVSSSTALKLP